MDKFFASLTYFVKNMIILHTQQVRYFITKWGDAQFYEPVTTWKLKLLNTLYNSNYSQMTFKVKYSVKSMSNATCRKLSPSFHLGGKDKSRFTHTAHQT